jgi:hypothetical protein
MTVLAALPDGPTLLSIHRPPTTDTDGEYLVAFTEGLPDWHHHQESALRTAGLRCSTYI